MRQCPRLSPREDLQEQKVYYLRKANSFGRQVLLGYMQIQEDGQRMIGGAGGGTGIAFSIYKPWLGGSVWLQIPAGLKLTGMLTDVLNCTSGAGLRRGGRVCMSEAWASLFL